MAVSGKARELPQKRIESRVGTQTAKITKTIYIVYILTTNATIFAPRLGSVLKYPYLTPSFHFEA